jgi:hypothetical protein
MDGDNLNNVRSDTGRKLRNKDENIRKGIYKIFYRVLNAFKKGYRCKSILGADSHIMLNRRL